MEKKFKDGILFALDGASGAGKTTLAFALVKAHPDLVLVPRYTTRNLRGSESDLLEYKFVTREQFSRMIDDGAFIEYRSFDFGVSYGLPRKETNAILKTGRNAVGIMNLGNVLQLKEKCPGAVAILIDASVKTLRQRLTERRTNTVDQIAERLANARSIEVIRPLYDDIVLNDGEFDVALNSLCGVIEGWIARKRTVLIG